jgi:hypothetical protein
VVATRFVIEPESLDLAREWACGDGRDGYANEYELDLKGLRVLNLNGEGFCILNWLAVLAMLRTYWQRGSISEEAKAYLQEHFSVDLEPLT